MGVVVRVANAGDIIRIQHVFEYLGQVGRNVFFYEISNVTDPTDPLFTWLDEYAAQVTSQIVAYQSNNLSYREIIAENLTDGVEISTLPYTETGTITGEPMPSYVAFNVKLSRRNKVTRNGSKRFSGVVESQVNGNVWTPPTGATADIQNFCSSSKQFVDYDGAGNDITIIPRIVGRTQNANGVYEIDLTRVNPIVGAVLNTTLTTQRTRKAD